MQDRKNKEFIIRVNNHSIYYSNRNAKKDSGRFIIIKEGVQIYDTQTLLESIRFALPEEKWTSKQRKKFETI